MSYATVVQRLAMLIGLVLVLAGCLSGAGAEVPFLLEQDYLRMNDAELAAYEQELSDELVRSSRAASGDVGLGIGFGSWGGSSGYGVRADKWMGGGPSRTTQDLKTRRDEVRNEMRRRGLLPQ